MIVDEACKSRFMEIPRVQVARTRIHQESIAFNQFAITLRYPRVGDRFRTLNLERRLASQAQQGSSELRRSDQTHADQRSAWNEITR